MRNNKNYKHTPMTNQLSSLLSTLRLDWYEYLSEDFNPLLHLNKTTATTTTTIDIYHEVETMLSTIITNRYYEFNNSLFIYKDIRLLYTQCVEIIEKINNGCIIIDKSAANTADDKKTNTDKTRDKSNTNDQKINNTLEILNTIANSLSLLSTLTSKLKTIKNNYKNTNNINNIKKCSEIIIKLQQLDSYNKIPLIKEIENKVKYNKRELMKVIKKELDTLLYYTGDDDDVNNNDANIAENIITNINISLDELIIIIINLNELQSIDNYLYKNVKYKIYGSISSIIENKTKNRATINKEVNNTILKKIIALLYRIYYNYNSIISKYTVSSSINYFSIEVPPNLKIFTKNGKEKIREEIVQEFSRFINDNYKGEDIDHQARNSFINLNNIVDNNITVKHKYHLYYSLSPTTTCIYGNYKKLSIDNILHRIEYILNKRKRKEIYYNERSNIVKELWYSIIKDNKNIAKDISDSTTTVNTTSNNTTNTINDNTVSGNIIELHKDLNALIRKKIKDEIKSKEKELLRLVIKITNDSKNTVDNNYLALNNKKKRMNISIVLIELFNKHSYLYNYDSFIECNTIILNRMEALIDEIFKCSIVKECIKLYGSSNDHKDQGTNNGNKNNTIKNNNNPLTTNINDQIIYMLDAFKRLIIIKHISYSSLILSYSSFTNILYAINSIKDLYSYFINTYSHSSSCDINNIINRYLLVMDKIKIGCMLEVYVSIIYYFDKLYREGCYYDDREDKRLEERNDDINYNKENMADKEDKGLEEIEINANNKNIIRNIIEIVCGINLAMNDSDTLEEGDNEWLSNIFYYLNSVINYYVINNIRNINARNVKEFRRFRDTLYFIEEFISTELDEGMEEGVLSEGLDDSITFISKYC